MKRKQTKPATESPAAGPNMTKARAAEIRRINRRIGVIERAERNLEARREKTIRRIQKECERTISYLQRKATKDIRSVKKTSGAEIKAIANEEAALLRRRFILEGRLAS